MTASDGLAGVDGTLKPKIMALLERSNAKTSVNVPPTSIANTMSFGVIIQTRLSSDIRSSHAGGDKPDGSSAKLNFAKPRAKFVIGLNDPIESSGQRIAFLRQRHYVMLHMQHL